MMFSKHLKLPDIVKESLEYNWETGEFYWKINKALMKKGDKAGHVMDIGYVTITVDYVAYYAHHLAIAFLTGFLPDPSKHIDHINGVKTDNRVWNLREVEAIINNHNRQQLNKNNSSGERGVFQTKKGRFIAFITINYKRKHIGTFDTIREAKIARDAEQLKRLGFV